MWITLRQMAQNFLKVELSFFPILAAISLLGSCGWYDGGLETSAPPPSNYSVNGPIGNQGQTTYRLIPGDRVSVTVNSKEDLSGEFVVAEDGLVQLPWVGGVQAQGRTLPEFQEVVRQRFAAGYLSDPQIYVTLLK
jgi:polysaccharide export outer membrane protein